MRKKPFNCKFWKRRNAQLEQDAHQISETEEPDWTAIQNCKSHKDSPVYGPLPFRRKPKSNEERTETTQSLEKLTATVSETSARNTSVTELSNSRAPVPFWRSLSTRFRLSHEPVAFDSTPTHKNQSCKDYTATQLSDRGLPMIEASSGAAARAAVAAAYQSERPSYSHSGRARSEALQQQEVLNLRKSRLVGQSLAKDTESGIGIDLREQVGDSLNPTVPVIRKGNDTLYPRLPCAYGLKQIPLEYFPRKSPPQYYLILMPPH